MSPASTIHANALLLGETGLLLRGASGAGKSALSFALIARARRARSFARLIGDDRVALEHCNGRVIARPHPAIAGLIELRGLGLVEQSYEPAGVIRCVVDLVAPGEPAPQRYPLPESRVTQLCGVELPCCFAEARDAAATEKIFLFLYGVNAKVRWS
jgi:HPr kinase/phosphorylase